MGVGMPGTIYLQQFGEHVRAAFGHVAYHVGSSLEKKDGWRDVDVRIMIPDADFEAAGFGAAAGYPNNSHTNQKWISTALAWSAFGKLLTGLPVDFQIQPLSWANENEGHQNGKSRSALFDVSACLAWHEKADKTRSAERERIVALICMGRHASDTQLADFIKNPPDWEG